MNRRYGAARRWTVALAGGVLLASAGCGDSEPVSTLKDETGQGPAAGSGDADVQTGADIDPASVDKCAIGVEAIEAVIVESAEAEPMDYVGCMWSGDNADGEYVYLSVDVDYAEDILNSEIVDDYEQLDGLGDRAYLQDQEDVISIRWEHSGLGIHLQEQAGDWEPDELVTVAKGIDADLP